MRPTGARVGRRLIGVAVAITLAIAAAGSVGGPALAAAPAPCPAAFPVSELVPGQVASGLTVEKGNTADPFTATVVGVIENGIAAGVDMIIVEADSPALQRAGGIWAGMSGSPVYAADGRLIGAVAYGLSAGPSRIGGVTPAAEMLKLLDRPGAAARAAKVALPAAIQQRVVASGAATAAEAASGLRQLPIPLGVSGINPAHLSKVSERLGRALPGARVYAAGAAAIGETAQAGSIFPGGNFTAAISYGDFSAIGVGTTTAVCSGDVTLAFGHPFRFSGASSMSVHEASAVYVQPDSLFGPFKVANPGGVAGRLDQDRLAGIRGRLGPAPAFVPVDSSVTSTDDGATRSATTRVNVRELLPDISALHLLQNLDSVFDRIGGGSSQVGWVIRGTRATGAPFTVDVGNRYANQFDVTFESIFDVLDQVAAVEGNRFEEAKVTGVEMTGSVSSTFKQYTLDSVLLRLPDGRLVPPPTGQPLKVVAGTRLNLRAVLVPYRNIGPARNVDFSVVVPPGTAGAFGSVQVVGGPGGGDPGEAGPSPASFDELLAQLRGLVPNNAVTANLTVEQEGPSGFVTRRRSARELVDQVVVGGRSFPITVVAPRASRPGVVDGNVWKLRSSLSAGPATTTFTFGTSTDRALAGDWDGNGTLTPAVFRNGTWSVRTTSTTSTPVTFTFGQAGDVPVAGDWDGDGRDTIGVYRGGRWLLRNSLSAGPADLDFVYGTAAQRPVTGDWDGDGIDSVGLFRAGTWSLRNLNSAGTARYVFSFGSSPGDKPVVGEWDADGRDTIGVYRAGRWLLRNNLSGGPAALGFPYGGPTSRPVVWG